jgi:hypothetical protein
MLSPLDLLTLAALIAAGVALGTVVASEPTQLAVPAILLAVSLAWGP